MLHYLGLFVSLSNLRLSEATLDELGIELSFFFLIRMQDMQKPLLGKHLGD